MGQIRRHHAGQQQQGEQPPQAAGPAPLQAPSVTSSWQAEHPVVGLAWLEGPVLAIVTEHGPRTLIHLCDRPGEPPACTAGLGKWSLFSVAGML